MKKRATGRPCKLKKDRKVFIGLSVSGESKKKLTGMSIKQKRSASAIADEIIQGYGK